jgi:hypothetical protein
MDKVSPRTAVAVALATIGVPAPALAQQDAAWQFQATLYGYFPTISGTTRFDGHGGSSGVSADIGDILENLKFAFMGAFEARKGRWGVYADVIYLDVGNHVQATRALTLDRVGVPLGAQADVGYDLKGWVTTVGGAYRALADPDFHLDVVGGVRVLNVRPKVDWSFTGNVGAIPLADRAGSRDFSEQNWDAIVGVRGRTVPAKDQNWFLQYYLDVGTGESRFTWQAVAAIGYRFGWGDVLAGWRYTDYVLKPEQRIQDLNFSGPAVGAAFRW